MKSGFHLRRDSLIAQVLATEPADRLVRDGSGAVPAAAPDTWRRLA
jgi:hypothetical protein